MSKGARLRAEKARQVDPRRTPWSPPRPGEQIEIAFLPGLCLATAEAMLEMRQQTHDGLLDMVGPRRRSGVRWLHAHGRAECARLLRQMYGDSAEHWATVETEFLPFLAEHGDAAVMVVAECDAAVPRPATGDLQSKEKPE